VFNPTKTLCSACKHYKEAEIVSLRLNVEAKIIASCDLGIFSLPMHIGRIAVPMDYECFKFEVWDDSI
jgi:hypothetical protein